MSGPRDADDHTTDEAELDLHGEGANEPTQGADPEFQPGEVGDEEEAPDVVGADGDRSTTEREHMVEELRDDE